MAAFVARSPSPSFCPPISPPKSYRSATSPSLSPTPSLSSTTSIRSSSSFRPRSSFSRYSPYPKVDVKVERDGNAVEELRDARDLELERLNLNRGQVKYRSISPGEEIPTPRPRTRFSPAHSSDPKRRTHRRAYSLSQLSYGFMFFPPTKPASVKSSPVPSVRAEYPRSREQSIKHTRAYSAATVPAPHTRTVAAPAKSRQQVRFEPAVTPITERVSVLHIRNICSHTLPFPRTPSPTPQPPRSQSPTGANQDRRLVFVNPQIALHLQQGGMVSIRSVDGQKSFKVCLPALLGGREKVPRGGVEMVRSEKLCRIPAHITRGLASCERAL